MHTSSSRNTVYVIIVTVEGKYDTESEKLLGVFDHCHL